MGRWHPPGGNAESDKDRQHGQPPQKTGRAQGSVQWPLVHISLDAQPDGKPCLLDQLAAPEAEPAISEAINGLGLEQLVDQLPAAQATVLRLTVLEGLSLRAADERLEISPIAQACWMPRVKSGHPWPRLMASNS